MNVVFLLFVFAAFVATAWRQITFVPAAAGAETPMHALGTAMIATAGDAVTLAIGLIGVLALFLGLMKVAESGGLLVIIARTIRPLMVRLFPDVPADHPAMGSMVLNLSASALGLGNAATPFGLRAMQQLDELNPHKGVASDAMVMFLAINTSIVTLVPTSVIALRAAAGSDDPAGVLPTTLFASLLSTAVAILAVRLFRRLSPLPPAVPAPMAAKAGDGETTRPADPPAGDDAALATRGAYPGWVSALVLGLLVAAIPLTIVFGKETAPWILPGLMIALLSFGVCRGVRVYEAFVDGAAEGFRIAIKIIPYLVAILVAIGMLRASGVLDLVVTALSPLTEPLGLPGAALPMALLRPLSGSAGYGILAATLNDPAIGPDSYVGYLVSTIQGSTETTFYVIAVYFGAVQVRRMRHTLAAALTADAAGIAASVLACTVLFARGG